MKINSSFIVNALNKYTLYILAFFALLTLLPYVQFLKPLQIAYTSGLIYRGILSGLIVLFLIFAVFAYRTKLPKIIYLSVIVYFVSQIITIIVTPVVKDVNIPIITTIMGITQSLTISLTAIGFLSITKNINLENKTIRRLCIIMVLFGFLLCLYSYIFEYEDIYNTFNTIYGWNYDVTSIFIDKTTYGFVLFVCSIFSIILTLNTKKYWMYIIPVFFLTNMFISRSKTSILCTTIILLCLLAIHLTKSWNVHKRIWIETIIFVASLISTITVLTITKIGIFSNFNYYITQVIFNDGIVVMQDRIHKWSLLIKAVDNPFNIIFGNGERITPLVLSECGCATIGDNIYLTNYGIGGIIKLTLYLALAAYVIYITWKQSISLSQKIICLTIQLSFIIGGLFEDDSIIGMTASGLFSSIVFYSCNKMLKVDLSND